MGVADNFSAKRWADEIIAMAEGHKHAAGPQIGEMQAVAPKEAPSMVIAEEFSAKAWTMMMLARASRSTAEA